MNSSITTPTWTGTPTLTIPNTSIYPGPIYNQPYQNQISYPVQQGDLVITKVQNGYTVKTVDLYGSANKVYVAESVDQLGDLIKQVLVEQKLAQTEGTTK